MMSQGVFGATVWSVQYVLCLYSCLEYLGQACGSTCLCHLMQSLEAELPALPGPVWAEAGSALFDKPAACWQLFA